MNVPTLTPLFSLNSPLANLGKVTLFKHTWDDHIVTGHPEMAGKIDAVRRTIANPTAVVVSQSTGEHYIFVNHDERAGGGGAPLTAVVSISEAVVCTTFYNRSYRALPAPGSVIWSR
jgi:hypothetical protein